MKEGTMLKQGNAWRYLVLFSVATAIPVWGQVADRPLLGQAEIVANDVYIRSGPSLNHYPVCKLNAGARVTVVAESGEWYELVPPASVISFISGDYVDSSDGRSGVVNGNNVRVRAGSVLPEFAKLKYVVQTKLSKGVEVEILTRDPDGFLRIKPPQGTTVWVNRSFVEMVPVGAAAIEPNTANASTPQAGEMVTETRDDAVEQTLPPPSLDKRAATLREVRDGGLRDELKRLDALASAELAKTVAERQLDPVIAKYRSLANQDGDEFSKRYAEARIAQLSGMAKVVRAVRTMRRLSDAADSKRREYLEARATIGSKLPPVPTELDAQGELRTSALYPVGTLPRRYRLVDTSGPADRTIGYVEIPVDSNIDVDRFLGSYVGIRATAKRLQRGGVNPVPIYVAGDIVPLKPSGDDQSSDRRRGP